MPYTRRREYLLVIQHTGQDGYHTGQAQDLEEEGRRYGMRRVISHCLQCFPRTHHHADGLLLCAGKICMPLLQQNMHAPLTANVRSTWMWWGNRLEQQYGMVTLCPFQRHPPPPSRAFETVTDHSPLPKNSSHC